MNNTVRKLIHNKTIFDKVVYPRTENELIDALKLLKSENIKPIIVGNCSNILFKSQRSHYTIISLSKMSNFCHVHDNIIEVSANFNSISLAFKVNEIGSNNFNFLSGVPGTIGGNIIMNAGCYGYEISRYLIDIKVVDEKLNIITIPKKDIEFGYRNSSLMARNIVVISARIRLVYTQVPSILTLQEKRNKTQPVGKRTLGSTFSNPGRFSAWKLIDSVGLRGFKIGNSKISDKHPNFIEALENSRNEEYWGLVQLMKKMVYLKHKIRLDREIIMYT